MLLLRLRAGGKGVADDQVAVEMRLRRRIETEAPASHGAVSFVLGQYAKQPDVLADSADAGRIPAPPFASGNPRRTLDRLVKVLTDGAFER